MHDPKPLIQISEKWTWTSLEDGSALGLANQLFVTVIIIFMNILLVSFFMIVQRVVYLRTQHAYKEA